MKNGLMCYSISTDKDLKKRPNTVKCYRRRVLYPDYPLSVIISEKDHIKDLELRYGFNNRRFKSFEGNGWSIDCDVKNGFVYEIKFKERAHLNKIKDQIEPKVKTSRGKNNFMFAFSIITKIINLP